MRAGAFWAPAEGTQPGHLNAGTGERQLPSSALSLGTVGGHDPLPRQNPPMLTLRLTAPNDYDIHDDGQRIGRIRYASERNPDVWHVQVHIPGPPFGSANSLDDAKASFEAAWLAFRAKHGAEELVKAYAAMNKRDEP